MLNDTFMSINNSKKEKTQDIDKGFCYLAITKVLQNANYIVNKNIVKKGKKKSGEISVYLFYFYQLFIIYHNIPLLYTIPYSKNMTYMLQTKIVLQKTSNGDKTMCVF